MAKKFIFVGVKFYLIGISSIDISKELCNGGGQQHHYLSDLITHCVADQLDDEAIEARDLFQLKVVHSNWVRFSILSGQKLPTEPFELFPSHSLLKKVVVWTFQINPIDQLLIWALVVSHGGIYIKNLKDKVTHILTNKFNEKKLKNISSKVKIVSPNWLLESVACKKLLPEKKFHPKFFALGSTSPSNEKIQNLEKQENGSVYKKKLLESSKLFNGLVFYIDDYKNILFPEEITIWKNLIEKCGGCVDSNYSLLVTHLLCSSQNSTFFSAALKDHKNIRTAYWLNDCIVREKLLPVFHILHIPLKDSFRLLCTSHIASSTNFKGYEKLLLKRILVSMGATYTEVFSKRNSILIFKRPHGIKYKMAQIWGIPTVSFEWINNLIKRHLFSTSLSFFLTDNIIEY